MKTTAVMLAALVAAGAASAARKPMKPKPWQWTTATAARQLTAANPAVFGEPGALTARRCGGIGKHRDRRYAAFKCAVSFEPRSLGDPRRTGIVWVKVRRQATGQPCASTEGLASIPPACTNPKGARGDGTLDDAAAQTQAAVGGPGGLYQGQVGCVGFGAGFWRCWFGTESDGPDAGHANVVFLARGQRVTIIGQPSS